MKPLRGIRIVSLALNLPGPAALMRLTAMGARCTKVNPPAGDPMQHMSAAAFAQMHQGIRQITLDLKTGTGQKKLHQHLAKADVLLTSFRPSALKRLGLGWKALHRQYPQLCHLEIVGEAGTLAEVPGHDLTYQAEAGLVRGLDTPATLFADMAGALLASEACLQMLWQRHTKQGNGQRVQVALAQAAHWLALPRQWALTTPHAVVGGGHAGYRLYPCADGRVAVAALEPHFAQTLCKLAGIAIEHPVHSLFLPPVHQHMAAYFSGLTQAEIAQIAARHDLPLLALPQ